MVLHRHVRFGCLVVLAAFVSCYLLFWGVMIGLAAIPLIVGVHVRRYAFPIALAYNLLFVTSFFAFRHLFFDVPGYPNVGRDTAAIAAAAACLTSPLVWLVTALRQAAARGE